MRLNTNKALRTLVAKNGARRLKSCVYLPVLAGLFVLLAAGCGDEDNGAGVSMVPDDIRQDDQAFPFVADGSYADVLKQCTLVGMTTESCKLDRLPFIASASSEVPTVNDIMQRVLVTHDWMGQRFNDLLVRFPDDMRYLFGSVTAIYIGSTVRPSFYSSLNGAIHLDPSVLWLSNDEKRSISRQEDYRATFGADLSFDFYQRFVNRQGRAWRFYPLDSMVERTLEDIEQPVARLLFHELAHVNDFMPATERAAVDTSLPVYRAIASVSSAISDQLEADYPLNSTLLDGLAAVRYAGSTATAKQSGISADVAGAQMQADGALYFYGYSAMTEDLAGLFVAAMMKIHYDVEVDTAYVNKPVGTSAFSCNYKIGWGTHNRLGNTLVATRSRFVLESMMGQQPRFDAFFANSTGVEEAYLPDRGWCDSLAQGQ